MSALSIIELVLGLLQSVLSNVKGTDLEQKIAQNVQAAITELLTVQGQPVTYQQLESLRVKVTF